MALPSYLNRVYAASRLSEQSSGGWFLQIRQACFLPLVHSRFKGRENPHFALSLSQGWLFTTGWGHYEAHLEGLRLPPLQNIISRKIKTDISISFSLCEIGPLRKKKRAEKDRNQFGAAAVSKWEEKLIVGRDGGCRMNGGKMNRDLDLMHNNKRYI